MGRGGSGKWRAFCGLGRSIEVPAAGHFDGEFSERLAGDQAGAVEQGCGLEPQALGDCRSPSNEYQVRLTHVGQAAMRRQRGRECVAQRAVECFDAPCPIDQGRERRFRERWTRARGSGARGGAARHGWSRIRLEMNIIIVARPFSTPQVLRFGHWRSYAWLGAGASAVLGTVLALGVLLGALFVGPQQARAELDAARTQLEAQRAEIEQVRASVARDVDALAVRLGRLQAEATRLNALGERLAKAGKLDDGEFDFSAEPGLGGAASVAPVATSLSLPDAGSALAQLEAQFDTQSRQLGVLESVLIDEQLDRSLLPAGMPIRAGYISSGYGYRTDPFTGRPDFHPGVDFNGELNQAVLAVAAGVASFVGVKPGYGNVVEIDHGNGFVTRYAHNNANLVQLGNTVRAGDVIARMGRTGRATGVHVHFEVWRDGRLVNPSQYVRAMR